MSRLPESLHFSTSLGMTPASTLLQRFPKVLYRLFNPLLELNSRFPTEDFFRASYVRLAHLRVVHGQGFVFDRGVRPRDSDDFLCKLFDGHLAWVADVDRFVEIAHRKPENSVDQIGRVTK